MYEQIVNQEGSDFCSIDRVKIAQAEERMGIKFPHELKQFYEEVGCGFVASDGAINRVISPMECARIRLREGIYEGDPDLEMYESCEEESLLFFEIMEGVYASIALGPDERNKVYFADEKIADSLFEFLSKIKKSDYWVEENK